MDLMAFRKSRTLFTRNRATKVAPRRPTIPILYEPVCWVRVEREELGTNPSNKYIIIIPSLTIPERLGVSGRYARGDARHWLGLGVRE